MEPTHKSVSDTPAPTRRFKRRWILYGLLAMAYLPQVPGCLTAHAPKFGRVVDENGKGMPDVAVIASADVSTSGGAPFLPETRSGFDTEYRVVAITDKEGKYWIPSTWTDLPLVHFLPVFGDFEENWHLVAIKPGYVARADEDAWKTITPAQRALLPHSTFIKAIIDPPPISWWLGVVIGVHNIELKPTNGNLQELVRYYDSQPNVNVDFRYFNTPKEHALLIRAMYNYFLPMVCGLPPDTALRSEISSLYTPDPVTFYQTLQRLDPDGFQVGYSFAVPDKYRWLHSHPVPKERRSFSAKNVCIALKAAGGSTQ